MTIEHQFPPVTPVLAEWERADPAGWILDALQGTDISTLSGNDAMTVVIAAQRLMAATQAIQLQAAAQVAATCQVPKVEIALGLTATEHGAERLLYHADAVTRLPRLFALVRSGDLDFYRFSVVQDVVGDHPDDTVLAVDAALAEVAVSKNSSALRRTARRLLHRIDPDTAQQRVQQRQAERTVQLWPQDDAMAELRALLPITDAQRLYDRLTHDAKTALDGGDARGIDALRADALIHRVLGDNGGARPVDVKVIVSADTLLRLSTEPGHLDGVGPIPAELSRILTAEGQWRIFRQDHDEHLEAVSSKTYRPNTALAEFIRTRDVTCQFPGCSARATTCDLDHTIPYPTGITCACNLQARCRRHHRLKHNYGFHIHQRTDTEETKLIAPLGRHYIVSPQPRPFAKSLANHEDFDSYSQQKCET